MININSLKKIWQNQKNDKLAESSTINKMQFALKKIKKFEKNQFRINLAKTAAVSIAFIFLIYTIFVNASFSMLTISGMIWLFLSIIVFLFIYWKNQFSINKLQISYSSTKLLDSVVGKLNKQKKLFKETFWMFGISMVIGLNIIYFDLLNDLILTEKLLFHFLMSLFLFGAIFIGIKVRKFRFKKEYQPLIDELLMIKKDLGDINGS